MTRAAACVLLLALSACGQPPAGIPDVDVMIRVTAASQEITPGKSFPLTVVRVWEKTLDPQPWDARALAPLVLKLETTSRREDAARVEETHRYRAYAFSRKDLQVSAVPFVARTPEAERRVARSQRIQLRVRPELDAADPGAPELPELPDRDRTPPWFWTLYVVVGALVVVGGVWAVVRWRAGPRPSKPAPGESSAARARRRLQALREGVVDPAGDAMAIAGLLRDYLAEAHAIRAHERTTEEVRAAMAHGGWAPTCRALIADLLSGADRIKYGRFESTVAARAQAFDAAQEALTQLEAGARP